MAWILLIGETINERLMVVGLKCHECLGGGCAEFGPETECGKGQLLPEFQRGQWEKGWRGNNKSFSSLSVQTGEIQASVVFLITVLETSELSAPSCLESSLLLYQPNCHSKLHEL